MWKELYLGDEFHYILECEYYKEKRKLLIKKYIIEIHHFQIQIVVSGKG